MNFLKKLLAEGCIIFTVITLIFYSVGAIVSNEEKSFIPSIKFIWLFFLFSLLLGAANQILSVKKIGLAVRMLIHFTVCAALYFVCVVLCGGFISNGAQTLIAMALFTLLYIVCGTISAIVIHKKEKKLGESKEYVSQFR